MVDLWTYQKKEIEAARLEAGEDEKLEPRSAFCKF